MIYREARQGDIPHVIKLFRMAFRGYPLFENMISKKNKKRSKFLYGVHALNTRLFYKHQKCFVCEAEGKIVAAALLYQPDTPEPGLFGYLGTGGLSLLVRFPLETLRVLRVAEECMRPCVRQEGRIWYIEELAVHPAWQSKRLGSGLLRDCLIPYIAEEGGGLLTLNTNTEHNRAFYKSCGLEEFYEGSIRRRKWTIGNWCYRLEIPPTDADQTID